MHQKLDPLVTTFVGEDVLPLIRILHGKESANVSEFRIAEMLNITVNQARNMLYRLYEQNLVEFIRKKDKKKGWYIYYWSVNWKGAKGTWWKVLARQVDDLKARLAREEAGMFYVCPMGCIRLPVETAMEQEFRCQECGTLMKEQDNSRTVANVKKMIAELEQRMVPEPLEEKKPVKRKVLVKKVKKKLHVKTVVKKKKR